MKALMLGYKQKYPECAPLFTQYSFRPHPVQKPKLISLCENAFYQGYEMAISFSKGVREFEWPFEKAWTTLQTLHSTAHKHIDDVEDLKKINSNIRGYCFANGLEKSFKLNYEIILKNGLPTHLYDAHNEEVDELKGVLFAVNTLREKLGLSHVRSKAINEFRRLKLQEQQLNPHINQSSLQSHMKHDLNELKRSAVKAPLYSGGVDVDNLMKEVDLDNTNAKTTETDNEIGDVESGFDSGLNEAGGESGDEQSYNLNGEITVDSLVTDDGDMGGNEEVGNELVAEPDSVDEPETVEDPDTLSEADQDLISNIDEVEDSISLVNPELEEDDQ